MAEVNLSIKIGVSPDAPVFILKIKNTTSLGEMKRMISEQHDQDSGTLSGLENQQAFPTGPPDRLRLVINGKQFFDDQEDTPIDRLGIEDGTTVFVIISNSQPPSADEGNEKDDDEEKQDILLECADIRFALTTDGADKAMLRKKLVPILVEHKMSSLMSEIFEENKWDVDPEVKSGIDASIKKRLDELEEKHKDMEENAGDVEVLDVEIEKAKFVALTHGKDEAIKTWMAIKGLTKGKQIDRNLAVLRICLAYADDTGFQKYKEATKKMIDDHGDWDRRNRYFIYEALFYLRIRNFSSAASNLEKAIATFAATEICDYNTFVFYTVVASIVSMARVDFKKKVVHKPEVLTVIETMPILQTFMKALVDCKYNVFLKNLALLMDSIRKNRYLTRHATWFLREMRLIGYSQFLKAYQSVSLSTMAYQFGISTAFLDREISSYVASGRLQCKIDKISGIVETMKTERRNTDYMEMIKKGDELLSRVQMLTKVITV